MFSPICGDRAESYVWVITPGLSRLALAMVLMPAPPPRDTQLLSAPAQKLMLRQNRCQMCLRLCEF